MRPSMLAALLLAVAAIAQAVAPEATPDASPARLGVADSVETERVAATFVDPAGVPGDTLVADSVASASVVADAPAAAPRPPEAGVEEAAPPQPVRYAAEATGLIVTFPAGWDGPSSVSEADLPAYAHYTFTNAASGSPLAGATLHVERVVGLNALDQQRWTRGLTPYGYHGLRPVGPASVPLPGLGMELEGAGVGGAVAFVQRGQTFWAVHVQAPTALWSADRAEAIALLGSVRLP